VVGVDQSAGMLGHALPRLDGHAVRGDATRLPFADGSVDAVTFMWLLHLVPDEVVGGAVAEAARILRPGGVLITTVDKAAAPYETPSDVGALIEPVYHALVPAPSDDRAKVGELGRRFGLSAGPESGYVGHGQGRSARHWSRVLKGDHAWARTADPAVIEELCERIAALPDQDAQRPDPVYRLAVLTKGW
jgi:SAM-dependent methyltransferase